MNFSWGMLIGYDANIGLVPREIPLDHEFFSAPDPQKG
jgi:hypothetical protein